MKPLDTPHAIASRLDARGLLPMAEAVAAQYRVTLEELFGRRRTRHVSVARAAFWAELRKIDLSYPAIGELVSRDHSTIMSAVKMLQSVQGGGS